MSSIKIERVEEAIKQYILNNPAWFDKIATEISMRIKDSVRYQLTMVTGRDYYATGKWVKGAPPKDNDAYLCFLDEEYLLDDPMDRMQVLSFDGNDRDSILRYIVCHSKVNVPYKEGR